MRKIEIAQLDSNLQADIENETSGWDLYEVADPKHAGDWQILWSPNAGRAGLVYVGNGSNGATHWTDATSPEDAFRRLQADELSA